MADPVSQDGEPILEAILNDANLADRVEVETAPESYFEQLLRVFDRDSDAEITPEEFVGRDFQRFDADGNGHVTLADFPGESGEVEPRVVRALDLILARTVVRTTFGDDWQLVFRRLDSDSNMRLSRKEFAAAAPPHQSGRRDPFAALLASAGSWDDDELDWAELDAFLQ